jgi:uncharacterized protein GlcG (DUF336 family)
MITLDAAQRIIAAALEEAGQRGLKPLSVVVLDARGSLKAAIAQDGTSLLRDKIAHGKAFGALGLGLGSRALYRRAEEHPFFISAANAIAGGALVPVPGGVLVRDERGEIIGAVGVSGDTSDHDEICAMAGVSAAGFDPDTG